METRGYKVLEAGINLLAIHVSDKTLSEINPGKASAA